MNTQDLAKTLSDVDAPETWGQHAKNIDTQIKTEVLNLAEMLWTERMARTDNLLLHPDVLDQLKKQNWKPTDLQKRMIWASVLALASGPNSKERFNIIRRDCLKSMDEIGGKMYTNGKQMPEQLKNVLENSNLQMVQL
ncbi:hypothetical protein [Moritella sp. 36]|uniref:hypothetical protein n=1 Tax=Moritella sp. 36 TaxID=2746233 RepID=UPI002104D753|nr:hypothetical protein [Moritella sp. 36]